MGEYYPLECKGFMATLQSALLAECQQVASSEDFARAKVLDLGCGYGHSTSQIADFFPHCNSVLGVDKDEKAIDYAFAFLADEKKDFQVADMEDQLTLELGWGGRFDWALSSQALFFARDQPLALRNLLWCLRPGGRCFVAVPALKPPDVHAAANKVVRGDSWKHLFQPSSGGEEGCVGDLVDARCNRLWFAHEHADRLYSALLEQVGYQVLHTRLLPFRYVFATPQEYADCLKCLMRKPLQMVPEEKRDIFLKEFLKVASKKATKTPGGAVIWNLKYAVVLAKRPEV